MLRQFFAASRRVCDKIEPHLPTYKTNPHVMMESYSRIVASYANAKVGQTVADVGSGTQCLFAKYVNPTTKTHIIAIDSSADQLRYNPDTEDKRVADAARGLPLEVKEADILASSWLLEHLENLEHFVADSRRVLKEGGYSIHLLPSKFAPFALINQALPEFLRLKLLHFFDPQSKEGRGFRAFYDRCYYTSISELFCRCGFEVVDVRLGYYQSWYYKFFIPLFLVSALYEILIQAIGSKNLAPYMLIIAHKNASET